MMAQVVHKVSPAVVRERIHASPEEIAAFCRAHHIRWLALIRSALRDDFRNGSDVDVRVEFAAHSPGTFFDVYRIAEASSGLFAGRKTALVTPASLHRLIRDRLLPLVEVQYAELIVELEKIVPPEMQAEM